MIDKILREIAKARCNNHAIDYIELTDSEYRELEREVDLTLVHTGFMRSKAKFDGYPIRIVKD